MPRSMFMLMLCLACLANPARPAALDPVRAPSASGLPRSAPEAEGISSAAIGEFVRAAQQNVHDIHSFMIVRHGRIVAEGWWAPYAAGRPHMLYSLSKSFTSTAVGLAVSEGRLSLNDPVLSFFPGEAPATVGDNLRAMRVRDLLAMSTGAARDTLNPILEGPDQDWVRTFLSQPVEYTPGTHFVYNSGATYMLSAIVQNRTGQAVLDYLTPRLFEPLGIPKPTWETSPAGINCGGWGLKLRTEDIAKFGLLYLNKGIWNGRRILPAGWVEQATAVHSDNSANSDPDWRQGYGFQFWRCRYGAFRGDGAFGQFCVVMPDQDAVVVLTSGTGNLQGELELVWKYLLPAMKPGALPGDARARGQLEKTLAALKLEPIQGQSAPALAKAVAGRTYLFENAPKLSYLFVAKDRTIAKIKLEPGESSSILTLVDDHGTHRITCGQGTWVENSNAHPTAAGDADLQTVAASGAWTAPDTWTARLCLPETPFCLTLRCRFAGDRMTVSYQREAGAKPIEFTSTGVESK